jgi:CubicO group peptidase (beta-lactamase class C family)
LTHFRIAPMRLLAPFPGLALLLLTVTGTRPAAGQPRPASSPPVPTLTTATVDSLARRVLADWRVPGIAIGIVKDGKVLLTTGVGFRDLERRLPATPTTLFGIGSNTKSFTALLLALLVDDRLLDWDEPVHRFLPDFELMDPVATRLATLPDLLSHMTGLPRHDGLWYGRSSSRREILGRLRYLESNTTFRARWQYNNLMFLTAGLAAERVTGKTWDELIRERILAPLGMTATFTGYRDQLAAPELAQPYELRSDTIEAVPLRDVDDVGPAGSIGSTVVDMLKYVSMFLEGGVVGGRQAISAAALRAIQTPRVMMGVDIAAPESEFPELGFRAYALGLAKTYYRGELMVLHGGGIDGYTSQMTWLPHRRMGIVVLTNSTSPASEILSYSLYDRLLGLPPVDWNGRLLTALRQAGATGSPSIAAPTQPTRPLTDYAGTYQHPGYGTIKIAVEDGELLLEWDRFRTSLTPRSYDVFQSGAAAKRWGINLATFTATFVGNVEGVIDRLDIPFEPAVAPIVFRRTP